MNSTAHLDHLQATVTAFTGQMPTLSTITDYGTDGKTVLSPATDDLSRIAYDPATGRATGTVGIASLFRGVTASASTVLSFGTGG